MRAALLTQAELCNQGTIGLDIGLLQIVQQTTALTNHQQQTTTGVVILLVHLQMVVQVVDALGEQSDLHFGGTGVAFVAAVCCYDFLFGNGLYPPFSMPRNRRMPSESSVNRGSVNAVGTNRRKIYSTIISAFCKREGTIFL